MARKIGSTNTTTMMRAPRRTPPAHTSGVSRLELVSPKVEARASQAQASANLSMSIAQQNAQKWTGVPQDGAPFPDMQKVPDNSPLLQSFGATGTAIFGGIITSEEPNPDFYWKQGIQIYEQMLRNDAQIQAVREIVEMPILGARWSIKPGSDAPRDKEIASFVESCLFHDLSYETSQGLTRYQTWHEVLRHILMHLWYGFMAFEVNWKKEDGWIKWSRFTPLLPRTVWHWWVGDDNELAGIQQWTFKNYNYYFVDIAANKLLLFANRQEGNNYEGVSLLRTAYKHWYYKDNFYKVNAIGIERNAVSMPLWFLPEGFSNADVQNAQQAMANIRANEQMGITVPYGHNMEFPKNNQKYDATIQPSIDHHDVMIARNVLAQFINLGSTETGAYALADAQTRTFLNSEQARCVYIAQGMNPEIRRLVDWNFDDVETYPTLEASKIALTDLKDIAPGLAQLVTAGAIHPDPELEDFLRDAAGLPSAPKSVVVATNPTAQANAARPENANAQDHASQQTQNATPRGGNAAQEQAADDGDSSGDGGGDAGAGMVEQLATEIRLLREALDAGDAVTRGLESAEEAERTVKLFNPNHDAKGRFAVGAGPKAGNGGAGKRGAGAKAGGQKVVKVAQVAKRNEARAARAQGKVEAAQAAHEDKLNKLRADLKEKEVAQRANQKEFNKVIQKYVALQRNGAKPINHPDIVAWRKEAAPIGKAHDKAQREYMRAQEKLQEAERNGPRNPLKAAPRTEDLKARNRTKGIPSIEKEVRDADREDKRLAEHAVVRAEGEHWKGDEGLHPPFSVKQFESAKLTPLGGGQRGINASSTATIGGHKFLIKEVSEHNTLYGGSHIDAQYEADMHLAHVANGARYETHAEAASTEVARNLGMGEHVTDTYAFEHGGKQYVAVRWEAGAKPLAASHANDQAFEKHASEDMLRNMTLHEYLVSEPDRHAGNYLYDRKSGKAFEIDHGRSLRFNSTEIHGFSRAVDSWHERAGSTNNMHFDHQQLRDILSREHAVIGTMQRYHLDGGIPGVRARFAVLRELSQESNPTYADLERIATAHGQKGAP